MLLVEIPWASRVWALPFLSVLAPSERYAARQGKRHKKITEWAWQLLLQVRRWHPKREIIAVADSTYASLKLLFRCRSLSRPITFITRLRLDAALYEPAPARRRGQIGRPRLKGARLPNLSMVAEESTTVWKSTTIANWYGSGQRMVEITSETAVWYSTGLFAVPLRWVLVRDPQEEFKTQALSCVPILRLIRRRSSLGSSCDGSWRRPSKRCGDISDSRPKGSGRRWQYGEPHRLCWVCSRSSHCLRMTG
jgi:hypothetical protein